MSTNQDKHALMTYFETQYKAKYGRPPQINRIKHKFGFGEILDHVGKSESKELIDYFISMYRRPPRVEDFLYNYDDIKVRRDDEIEDIEHRKQLRERTRQRLEEWNKAHGES